MLELGDMAEIVDTAKGLDDRNRSYTIFPGVIGLVVDISIESVGLLIAQSIVYVPDRVIRKLNND
tara:strand:- start:78 stop:272 length:195 start_codon:yes stop_codon:yes gene_type:complete